MPKKYMLDTNVFNRVVEGRFSIDDLPQDGEYFFTHAQMDEINNTPDKYKEKRGDLLQVFTEINPHKVPTESMVFGYSRFNEGKLGDSPVYQKILDFLDDKKKKDSNIFDALIGETSVVNKMTLITGDKDLAEIVTSLRGSVVKIK